MADHPQPQDTGADPLQDERAQRRRTRLEQAMSVARQTLDHPLPPWTPSHLMDQPTRDIDDLIREIEANETRLPSTFEPYTAPTRERTITTERPRSQPPPPPQESEPTIVIDLRPKELSSAGPGPDHGGERFGLGSSWGAMWRWAAQGWVEDEAGNPVWRPVVTTTTELSRWDVHTYLGVVAGESAVRGSRNLGDLGDALEEARRKALNNLVSDAVGRGAHAVVGVQLAYTSVDDTVIVSATGTAATLQDR